MSIVDQFRAIPTTCISDAMQGLNSLDSSIKPLIDEHRVAGRAFTVKMPVGDNLAVLKAIREAKPGDIVVGDADGVVVIPQALEEKILKDSLDKIEKDEKRAAKYKSRRKTRA